MSSRMETALRRTAEGFRLGAPALVLLAACASAQAAPPEGRPGAVARVAPAHTASARRAWGGSDVAVCDWRQARKTLACHAAYVIHALDRLSSPATAEAVTAGATPERGLSDGWSAWPASLAKRLDPSSSTHQTAAP